MTLVKPLRETLSDAGLRDKKAGLHQVIAGDAAGEQARDYARELIQRGFLKNTPIELNCHQPMNEFMVQQAFKDAKGGMLLVTEIDHLARRETFAAEAERALEKDRCILVLCGPKRAMDIFLAETPELKQKLPDPIDMDAPAIRAELAETAERQRREEQDKFIKAHTVTQRPVRAMKPLKFAPKREK